MSKKRQASEWNIHKQILHFTCFGGFIQESIFLNCCMVLLKRSEICPLLMKSPQQSLLVKMLCCCTKRARSLPPHTDEKCPKSCPLIEGEILELLSKNIKRASNLPLLIKMSKKLPMEEADFSTF